MKIMLDTNVLISAFVFKSSIMNEVITKILNEHEIVIASYCIEELKGVIREKFNIDMKKVDKFLNNFPFHLVYSPESVERKLFEIRDECDYIILHTAVVENVDILITGDKDFKDVDVEYPKILTPREFLEKY